MNTIDTTRNDKAAWDGKNTIIDNAVIRDSGSGDRTVVHGESIRVGKAKSSGDDVITDGKSVRFTPDAGNRDASSQDIDRIRNFGRAISGSA